MTAPDSELEARLDELESRLSFQDDLIESLNQVITRQDRDLARLTLRLQGLVAKMDDIAEVATDPGDSPGHEIPPHY
jgi:SlyX protein